MKFRERLALAFDILRGRAEIRTREEQEQDERQTMEMIRNISHDLKTPITTIKGYAEGLLDGVADSPEKRERYLRVISGKVDEMEALVDQLATYSEVDTDRIAYNFCVLDLGEYFSDAAEDLSMELSARGLQFHYTNSAEEDVTVIADPEQLGRVIQNIVSNSIKYMDKPGGSVELRVSDVGDYIQVEVEDNGIGISRYDLPHVFDRFYRADASRNSMTGGSGIGLSIVRKIVEDHGGKIWAASVPGSGTTMTFVLRKSIVAVR